MERKTGKEDCKDRGLERNPKMLLMNLRPENELLLCCARTQLHAEKVERMASLLQTEMDWPYVSHLGGRHGLIPLLYKNLKSVCPERVPESVMDNFRNHFLLNAGHNVLRTRELLTLLDLFETHHVHAIPYKGPVLAASAYGDLALRQFSDLDILVQKQDIPKAKDLLISNGYRWLSELNPTQQKAYLRSDSGSFVFQKDDGRAVVEVDREITTLREFPFWLDLEPLWKRRVWISFEGRKVPVFSPEDLLLILCVHGAKHRWDQLNWICDLAELIRVHQGLDWGMLLERASALGCERILFLGLFLAQDLLGAPLPSDALKRVESDAAVRSLARYVCERLFLDGNGSSHGAFGLSSFYLRVSERLRDRAAYCLRLAFTPTVGDWELLPLPQSFAFVYYFVHPMVLTARYGMKSLRDLFNGKNKN
jgi:hypothetical protein